MVGSCTLVLADRPRALLRAWRSRRALWSLVLARDGRLSSVWLLPRLPAQTSAQAKSTKGGSASTRPCCFCATAHPFVCVSLFESRDDFPVPALALSDRKCVVATRHLPATPKCCSAATLRDIDV